MDEVQDVGVMRLFEAPADSRFLSSLDLAHPSGFTDAPGGRVLDRDQTIFCFSPVPPGTLQQHESE